MEILLAQKSNGIAQLTLNRPECHNAFNEQIIQLLIDQLINLKNDASVRVILLKANGKNFCAGADLEWMRKMAKYSKEENQQDALQLVKLLKLLKGLSKPTIALAQGITAGGGIGLLACCDCVITTQNAKFFFSETKLGIIPATIAPYIIQAIGSRSALFYFLTGETFTAQDAKQMHLIQEIVDEKDLLERGFNLAKILLKNGPKALTLIKQLVRKLTPAFSEELLQETADLIAQVRVSTEGQEGLSATLEKRAPQWEG